MKNKKTNHESDFVSKTCESVEIDEERSIGNENMRSRAIQGARSSSDASEKSFGPEWDVLMESAEEHKAQLGYYAIWETPEMVAGFMRSMCGVRVGSIGMAASLDSIGEKLAGIARFTKSDGQIEQKLGILRLVKSHAENGGWRFESMTRQQTLQQLDLLIEFCERAKAKGLNVRAWA